MTLRTQKESEQEEQKLVYKQTYKQNKRPPKLWVTE